MGAMLCAMFTTTALVACSSDDDDENGGGNGGGAPSELIFTNVSNAGWSGNLQNGVVTYVPYIVDEEDAEDEWQPYYAFNFSNGICQDAVFSLIFPNEEFAKYMANLFQSGEWATMDEDDDDYDDYDDYSYARKIQSRVKTMTRATTDLNVRDLALPVKRNGRVLYITIDCLKGKSGSTLQNIIIFWLTGEGTPEIVMGNWDDAKGRYTINNVFGLGINYVINTTFEESILTEYVTTMTFPNNTWANMMYEQLEEQNQQIGSIFGLYPEAEINGNVVSENAAIYGEVTKAQTMELIADIDWSFSRPFFTMFD